MTRGIALTMLLVSCVGCGVPDSEVPAAAQKIFRERCFGCHGADGQKRGGFASILDTNALLDAEVIVAGDADSSVLIEEVESGSMPKTGDSLTTGQISILRRWINGGMQAAASG